jgi:hypothetical protein
MNSTSNRDNTEANNDMDSDKNTDVGQGDYHRYV